jgi:hypothetical protein
MHLLEYTPRTSINCEAADGSLVSPTEHSLPLSSPKNGIQRKNKRKMEEAAESSTARKRLWLSDDDGGDADFSDSPEVEETEEEVEDSSEETWMNQLDTSEEKLYAWRACGILFSDDGNTPSMSSEPHALKSRWCSNE